MMSFIEMDKNVTINDQLGEGGGSVVLINRFVVSPEDVDQFMKAWTDDAVFMKQRHGFIMTQLYSGIAGSSVFLNYAVWESTDHFKAAFTSPAFQSKLSQYPSSAEASPHLFRKLAVSGICVA